MTTLRIDLNKFQAICEKVRYNWSIMTEAEKTLSNKFGGIVSDYRAAIENDPIKAAAVEVVDIDRAEELRSSLNVAARSAQQYGATESQIDFIVTLAIKNNDYNVLSGGRLTKADASHIIDVMANGIR